MLSILLYIFSVMIIRFYFGLFFGCIKKYNLAISSQCKGDCHRYNEEAKIEQSKVLIKWCFKFLWISNLIFDGATFLATKINIVNTISSTSSTRSFFPQYIVDVLTGFVDCLNKKTLTTDHAANSFVVCCFFAHTRNINIHITQFVRFIVMAQTLKFSLSLSLWI